MQSILRILKVFQSTSIIADGRRQGVTAHLLTEPTFQSTSIIADGRRALVVLVLLVVLSFNPRPSLLMDEGPYSRAKFQI